MHHYLFGDEIIQNGARKMSQEVHLQQLSPEKPNVLSGTQISSHWITGSVNNLNKKEETPSSGRKLTARSPDNVNAMRDSVGRSGHLEHVL